MRIIKEISEAIDDELESAENYARNACVYKEDHPELAETLYNISLEEMRHVDLLHKRVVDLIERYRKEHGDPPAAMLAVYDFLHKRDIEWANEIRSYQNRYREM
jgi:rubrerythrin